MNLCEILTDFTLYQIIPITSRANTDPSDPSDLSDGSDRSVMSDR